LRPNPRNVFPHVLALALLVFSTVATRSQTFVTPKGEAQNVRFEQRESGVVEIFYDLISSDPRAVFNVVLEGSQDNGGTWDMRPQTMVGDVGAGISPGTGKKIVWDSGKDMERVQFNSLRFRMLATGGPLSAPPKPPPPPSQGAKAANPPPTKTPPSSGGSNKKLLIGIGGGVLAAGGAAIALSGGGSNPGPTPTTTITTVAAPTISAVSVSGQTDVLIATANSVIFSVSAASSSGEGLSVSWSFGDGGSAGSTISNGTASTTKTFSNAGTFTARVTVTGAQGGSVSRDYQALTVGTVTGRWVGRAPSGNTFTMNLVQEGNTVRGDAVTDITLISNPLRVLNGAVSGPPSRMVFRLQETASRGAFYDMDVTGSSDQRTFTGTFTGQFSQTFVMTKQ
jgi:hypothetical protein